GVGEKTAAKLIQTYGTLENLLDHVDDLTPKIRGSLREAGTRLIENRDFFRFRSAKELEQQGVDISNLHVSFQDLEMGQWDFRKIRSLFDALEFRVLYERLAADRPEAAAAAAGFEGVTAGVDSVAELRSLTAQVSKQPVVTVRLVGNTADPGAPASTVAIATKDGARVVNIGNGLTSEKVWEELGPVLEKSAIATHGAKEALQRLSAVGIEPASLAMDTEIAAYLVDPARGSYGLDELARQWLDRELKLESSNGEEGQQTLALESEERNEDYISGPGLEAIATKELGAILAKELTERGAWDLFANLELPLARVLAKMELTGIKLDCDYLEDLSLTLAKQAEATQDLIFRYAGGPFNINSPPQLRDVLYQRLGLKPSKKTKTGFSTDAGVLESLAEEHPIVAAILRYREITKLKSTYIDALPRLVDPRTGRVHCRFNQTVATTGRLSSDSPNLQNIPIRTEEGKQIRRAFIPEAEHLLLVADYSQIELRLLAHLSGDQELIDAFARGDDIHRLSIGKALGIPYEEVTAAQRSIGKMVSYGVTYGMGPFGLSQRLRIPVDQARSYIEGFFASYPRVRPYLDSVVQRATEDGFTTTILGRRRYLPELKSRNPRVRSLGERQALNAPLQGSAADILKLAMVRVDQALDGSPTRMIMTVHDELVFEVPEQDVPATAKLVREKMENVVELSVPLTVDIASGPNWAEAKA
ncbi:MAG: DNA polymerase I, partial [Actinomycetota bacterium]|nr:DNA polymerase I [Actinomycetota bacterium]